MKQCGKCQVEKPFSEFNRDRQRPTGYQRYCRPCDNQMRRDWYQKRGNRERVLKLNSDKRAERRAWFQGLKLKMECARCGENHPAVLDLHHRDPSEKENGVTDMMAWGKKRILAEIAKCDVLCSNCHRKLHWEERNGPLAQRRSTPLSRERSRGQHPQGSPS